MLTYRLCDQVVLDKYTAVFKDCFSTEEILKGSSASRGLALNTSSKRILRTIFVFLILIRILWEYLFYTPSARAEAIVFKTQVSCYPPLGVLQ